MRTCDVFFLFRLCLNLIFVGVVAFRSSAKDDSAACDNLVNVCHTLLNDEIILPL